MKHLPNDISRCFGNKCCTGLKFKCKRWIENDKSECKIVPMSDFTPTKINGKMDCEFKISRK